VAEDMLPVHFYSTYFRHQSLEYINAGTWKVTLEPEELGEVASRL